MLRSVSAVCSATVVPVSSPVAGSNAAVPATWTRLPFRIPGESGSDSAAAPSSWIAIFAMGRSSFASCDVYRPPLVLVGVEQARHGIRRQRRADVVVGGQHGRGAQVA